MNQAYMLLTLCNNYYTVLICSFGLITGNMLQQKVYTFFLYLDNTDIF